MGWERNRERQEKVDSQKIAATLPAFFAAARILAIAASCASLPNSTPIESARSKGPICLGLLARYATRHATLRHTGWFGGRRSEVGG